MRRRIGEFPGKRRTRAGARLACPQEIGGTLCADCIDLGLNLLFALSGGSYIDPVPSDRMNGP
jgi:hypothetical protein